MTTYAYRFNNNVKSITSVYVVCNNDTDIPTL